MLAVGDQVTDGGDDLPEQWAPSSAASFLDGCSQSLNRLVPLCGSAGQVVSGFRDRIGPDGKPAFPSDTLARDHAGLFQHMQMLGDALARQIETVRELHDRVLPSRH